MNSKHDSKNYFDGLSRDELKDLLISAGFEVEDGIGEVIYTEPLEKKVNFTIKGEICFENKYTYNNPQWSISYPKAS